MTYNGVVVLQLDSMLEMEFILIQFLMVPSILATVPMCVYQECTSTELTRTHVRITLHRVCVISASNYIAIFHFSFLLGISVTEIEIVVLCFWSVCTTVEPPNSAHYWT